MTEPVLTDLPRRVYENPPVIEAIARVHWETPMPWNVATPGLLFEALRSEYPADPKFQNVLEAQFAHGEGADAGPNFQLRSQPQRVVFDTGVGAGLLIVGTNDISVHGLPPYEGWESLEARLFSAIEKLGHLAPMTDCSQIAIRYINRVEIPQTEIEFLKYLTIGFSMPPGWPNQISAFLDRVESVYPDGKSRISFTWATTDAPEGSSAFVLDLDLTSQVEPGVGLSEVRSLLAQLKIRETHAFESLLQDPLRELFREVG